MARKVFFRDLSTFAQLPTLSDKIVSLFFLETHLAKFHYFDFLSSRIMNSNLQPCLLYILNDVPLLTLFVIGLIVVFMLNLELWQRYIIDYTENWTNL